MKMAKASEADLKVAMDLCAAIENLIGWKPSVPPAVERVQDNEESEPFDRDDREQCKRVLNHLLDIASRASLMRVIWGAAVMLDPENKLVDPTADCIEHHPERRQREDLLLLALYNHQGASSAVGLPIRLALGIGQYDDLTPEQIARAKAAGNAHKPKLVITPTKQKEGGAG